MKKLKKPAKIKKDGNIYSIKPLLHLDAKQIIAKSIKKYHNNNDNNAKNNYMTRLKSYLALIFIKISD